MTERILWQTGTSYGLCNGQEHRLVTDDGAEWVQGACDCLDVDQPCWED